MNTRARLAGAAALGLVATSWVPSARATTPPAAAATTATVKALDNTFSPETITVAVGTTVTWENRGRNDHNIVPVDDAQIGEWGVVDKNDFTPKDTYEHTFNQPGTYAYYCTLHGTKDKGMIGTVVVTEDAAVASSAPGSATSGSTASASAGVHAVPADFPTIQAAVDAAAPGDLILVSPGIYHEAVNVTTDNLTLRGLDRNGVVLDGEFTKDNGIRVLGAKNVTVENMTAMNYTANGFFWTGVEGFHGAYLTAYRTGDYGVYTFDSVRGQLDHIYAAGSPDAGVYVGGCFPCNVVIDHVVSEHNGLGYSGTNSGGDLLIVNSTFRNNRAGIVPNSGSYEPCYPERKTTIVGNLVYSNNQGDTPAIDVALLAMGNGILPAGGVQNVIERNRVFDHDKSGIGLVPFLEEDPNDVVPTPDKWEVPCSVAKGEPVTQPEGGVLWDAQQNRVVGNVLENNRAADLIVASVGTDPATLGNCFSGNQFTTSAPNKVETLAPCDGAGSGDWADGAYNIATWLSEVHPSPADWKTATLPALAQLENMPDAATAPGHPATDMPSTVDLAAIQVPAKP